MLHTKPVHKPLCSPCPVTAFSSWNWVHMTEHNLHSNNYPHRDDVICLYNRVWTETRLNLSFHQPCPQSSHCFIWHMSIGMDSMPIKVTDWWRIGGQTWSTCIEVFWSLTLVKVEIQLVWIVQYNKSSITSITHHHQGFTIQSNAVKDKIEWKWTKYYIYLNL